MSEKTENVSMTLQELLDNGVRCYQEQNFKGAIFYLEHYISHDENNAEVLQVLAQLLCELGHYPKAVDLAARAVDLEPDNNEYRFTLAENCFLNNNFMRAEPLYLSLKEHYPLNTHILDRLISIYKKQGKTLAEKSIRSLKRKVEEKIDPFHSEIAKTVAVAKAMIESGSLEEAKLLLDGVLKLADDNLHANGLQAMMLMDEGKYEDAVKYFEKIKENLADEYYGSYAYAVEKSKGKDAALPILEEGVRLTPHNQELRKQLAILYFNLHRYQKSYKEMCQVLESSLHDRKYFMVRAVSRFMAIEEKGKWINLDILNAAADELKEVHDKYPDDEQVSFHLVKYYLNVGEIKQAYDLLCKSDFSDLKNKEWNKHPYFMATRDRQAFFNSYLNGHEQRLKLPLDSLNDRVWKGESLKGKNVVIMREQGIGDEILFAHNYNWIITQAENVSIFCSERLVKEFKRIFSGASFYPVLEKDGTLIYSAETQPIIFDADTVIFAGDLPAYCYCEFGRPLYNEAYYEVDFFKKEYWNSRVNQLVADGSKKKVGLIWRSGSIDGLRSSYYLNEKEMAQIVSAIPEVEFFNCMYVECKKELNYIQKRAGKKIHQFDELDQKNDFENLAAMLSCLDLLVGAYTATTSLAAAIGTDLVAYSSDYLSEDGKVEKEAFYYQNISHVSLPVNDKEKRVYAIEVIIKNIRKKLGL